MDELERAGRALRDAMGVHEPSEIVRTRARTIIRRRRMFAAASVVSVVIAMSAGVAIATRGRDGLDVHTIAPAGSTTTRSSVTRPTAPSTTVAPDGVEVPALPILAFTDARHGWRVEPLNRRVLEHTIDGGHTWTVAHIDVPGEESSLTGVVAIDDRHVFAIVVNRIGNQIPRLVKTTDGVHWQQTLGVGIDDRSNALFVSFVDASHGWGLTQYGGPITTSDAGDHWHAMAIPAEGEFGRGRGVVGSVCLAGRGAGWAATDQSVFRSTNDGASWQRQITIPVGGGTPVMTCNGPHAAYSSFEVGAGQHVGAFLRTDDGGAHWRPLTEDTVAGVTTVTAPGFPESQYRGDPSVFAADGTLLFTGGSSAEGQNWVVAALPSDHFVVGKFDSTGQDLVVSLAATASDAGHVFVETQTIPGRDPTWPRPVTLYASSDGGHTRQVRWTGQ